MDHDRVNNNKSNESNRRVAAEVAESVPATTPSSSSSSSTTPSFWRTNSRALPGRPSLNRPLGPSSPSSSGLIMAHSNNNHHMQKGSSFQTYQDSVSDAWDLGDDEFCIISGLSDTKISRRVSQSAAMNVIKTHRSGLSNNSQQSTGNVAINNNHSSRSTSTGAGDSLKEGSSTNNNRYSGAAGTVSVCETSSSSSSTGTTNHQSLNDSQEDTANENHPESKKKPRSMLHSYPGRPQLLKLTSNLSKDDVENQSKTEKFLGLLNEPLLNLIELKKLSWSGVPKRMRPVTWRLLSGYLPTALERRNAVLERKRIDYLKLVEQYFVEANRDEAQEETFRQIHIDVPRMNPHVQLFQQPIVQQMFERILFIWAIRHPASGYVQGINDLVTPFFIIFLQEALLNETSVELETFLVEQLSKEKRDIIEADSFWCLSKFLDCLQDNYIFAQLGIQAKVNQLKELIQRIDIQLHKHLVQHGIDYLQFSFRWMNNLLTRELPLHCTIRLWDTYLAESDEFAQFQLYVCAAFLLHWRAQLMQEREFQGLMLMVQNLPTHHWTDAEIKLLVAEAYRLKFTYADAPKHFEGKS